MADPKDMYQCQVANCGYIYNPEKGCKKRGVAKGTCWQDLPEGFCCPNCGASRKMFKPLAGPESATGQGR